MIRLLRILRQWLSEHKKPLFVIIGALCLSIMLGACDFIVAGYLRDRPIFSKGWARSGSTTYYFGLGYSLTCYNGMGDANGPEIWFWLTPFKIYKIPQHFGVRWLNSFDYGQHIKEPDYNGRSLSEWARVWFSGYSGVSPHATAQEQAEAETAIRAMGTNCIPALIAMLDDERPEVNQRSTALTIFQILGERAKSAAPELQKLITSKDSEVRQYAWDCLREIKPEKATLVSALTKLIHDPDKNMGLNAALLFIEVDSNAAQRAGVFERFPELR